MKSWQYFDIKQIWRDGALRLLLIAPVLILAVFVGGVPALGLWARAQYHFDWTPYRPFIAGFAAMLPPLLYGFMATFLVIDERDEGLIEYFRVTPLTARGYLRHRLGMVWILGTVGAAFTLALLWPGGLSFWLWLSTGIILGIQGVLFTLTITALASNKVEALAMGKLAGLILLFPAMAYFTTSPFRYLAAPIPHFWVGHLLRQMARDGAVLPTLMLACGLHLAVILIFLPPFFKRTD